MLNKVSLSVRGIAYEDWTDVQIHLSADELVPTFSVGYTRDWNESATVDIIEGDDVQVKVDGSLLMTGYAEDITESYNKTSHTVRVAGSAKTSLLVMCAADFEGAIMRELSFAEIATKLCAPFGITAELSTALKLALSDSLITQKFARISLSGRTVFDVLSDLAGRTGTILQTTPKGNLLITRAATVPSGNVIMTGENVIEGGYTRTTRDRFSEYLYKSQSAANDSWNGASSSHIKAKVKDSAVTLYKPITVIADVRDSKEIERRATWDRNVRAARSQSMNYTVDSWSGYTGLWAPNQLVTVQDGVLGISEQPMIIASVDLTKRRTDGDGTTAQLSLVGPGSYDIAEPPKVKRGKVKR